MIKTKNYIGSFGLRAVLYQLMLELEQCVNKVYISHVMLNCTYHWLHNGLTVILLQLHHLEHYNSYMVVTKRGDGAKCEAESRFLTSQSS